MRITKRCPYCAEEILVDAKKCKHCGEWLEVQPDKGSKDNTLTARELRNEIGITTPKKLAEDGTVGCLLAIVAVIAVAVGTYTHWFLGFILFLVGAVYGVRWYKKDND